MDPLIEKFVEFVKMTEVDDLTQDDFDPKVLWFDKGQEFARLTLIPRVNGDWIEALPRPVAMLTSAQEDTGHIAVVSDSLGCTSMTKHDGTPWEYGEMQTALRDQTVDADLVYECLMVLFCSAEGEITQTTIPYYRHDNAPITYGEPKTYSTESGAHQIGRLPWLLQKAFEQPKLGQAMRERFGSLGLTEQQATAHGLAIVVKMVMQQYGWPCMVGATSQEEQALLKRSFEEGPLSENIRAFDQDQVSEIVNLEDALALPDHLKEN